jgi:F0F1-type ATP synthase assembly protein I
MGPTNEKTSSKRKQYAFNLTLASVVGLSGCLTTLIILVALLLGLWLDNMMGSRPVFTIGIVVASMPVSLIAMVLSTKWIASRIKTGTMQDSQTSTKEENTSEISSL